MAGLQSRQTVLYSCFRSLTPLLGQQRDLQNDNLAEGIIDESKSTASKKEEGNSKRQQQDSDGEQQVREEILQAALPYVHTLGWSHQAIAQGAESLGYSSMVHSMFPSGGVDLVNFFYGHCNAKLDESLKAAGQATEESKETRKNTTSFIFGAVEERLRMNLQYYESWHQGLALHVMPSNLPMALHNIGTLVDTIWFHAGDRSYDMNWYTKRGLLAAVYKSTELCMLQDNSQDFQYTWAFLNRRLSDVHKVGKCMQEGTNFLGDAASLAKAGILTVLNINGMNTKSRC